MIIKGLPGLHYRIYGFEFWGFHFSISLKSKLPVILHKIWKFSKTGNTD